MSTSKESQTLTPINHGYKLGYYKQQSGRIREAIISIELIKNSKIVDERSHEIFDFIKTDLAKITKIEGLNGEKVEIAYLIKKPELKYDIKEGEIVRFKHCEFKEILPDHSYIGFYTTKIGALNDSMEVPKRYTGVIAHNYRNGRIKERYYYVNGDKTHTFGYYDNDFNSLYYTWQFEYNSKKTFPTIREYIYNQQENPIAQFIISNNKITNKTIYDKTNHIESIYLRNNLP